LRLSGSNSRRRRLRFAPIVSSVSLLLSAAPDAAGVAGTVPRLPYEGSLALGTVVRNLPASSGRVGLSALPRLPPTPSP